MRIFRQGTLNLMDIRFNMRATVLNRFGEDTSFDVNEEVKGGHWITQQDEITGAMTRVWQPDETYVKPPKIGNGTGWQVTTDRFDVECSVRGFPEVGFRSSANTENWEDGLYKALEAVQMIYPAKYVLNRRQLLTNIRDRDDKLLWIEEETGQPTVFEVQGVTPTFDPFGRHIHNLTVLKRSDVQ